MTPRYNIVVGVAILIDKEKVSEMDLKNILNASGLMISKLFPNQKENGMEINKCFISHVYQESHRVTYDLVGSFKPSHDLIMETSSEKECIEKHFSGTIADFLGHIEHEYEIFTLDTLVMEKK